MATRPGRYQTGAETAGGGFNSLTAGSKTYGGGRPMPNIGPSDPTGYAVRDAKARAQRDNLLRRLMAQQQGRHFSADAQRPISRYGGRL